MSAARRWRPLVAGTSGSLTEAIYGLILATSVIAVSAEYASSNTHHRRPNRSDVREALRHDWPLVEVTVPLVLILVLGMLDVVADKTAILAATLAVLVELAAAGAYAAHASGAGPRGTLASALIAVTLGGAVVLLKAVVH